MPQIPGARGEQLRLVRRKAAPHQLCTPRCDDREPVALGEIGEAELRAMKPDAYLVNIARGRVIDEPVLIRALREGWIGGAGLDVASQEPLPAESPLYDAPNVILTPHISGANERYAERLAALFADNLRRYRTGQPLRNLYDPQREY